MNVSVFEQDSNMRHIFADCISGTNNFPPSMQGQMHKDAYRFIEKTFIKKRRR